MLTKLINNIERIERKKIWLLIFALSVLIIAMAWNCDDAYHAYVMARNLVWGKGFVYSPGMRVDVTTCPLFTLMVAFAFWLGIEANVAGVVINVIASILAIIILNYKFCKNFFQALLADLLLATCYCFMNFTTSGLENSINYLWVALFVLVINKHVNFDYSAKELFCISLLLGLSAFTRMDIVLLFVPCVVFIFLRAKKINFAKRVLIGFAGLLPFILWEVFSLIYYGFWFPNTYYSKLNSGYSSLDYLKHGLWYFRDCIGIDIVFAIIPVFLFILAIKRKDYKGVMIDSGVLLYYLYILRTGGDFMMGRFFTVPYMLTLCELFAILKKMDDITLEKGVQKINRALCYVLLFSFIWKATVGVKTYLFLYEQLYNYSKTSVADERIFYYGDSNGIVPYIVSKFDGHDPKEDFFKYRKIEYDIDPDINIKAYYPPESVVFGMYVYQKQSEGSNIYLFDRYGLMDPLLTRLPAIKIDWFRTGHIKRDIPEGYLETLNSGVNQISDPDIAKLYDDIKLITTGPIWDQERIHLIIKSSMPKLTE